MYIIFGSWICVVAIGAVGAGDGADTGAGAAARYPKTKDRVRPSLFLDFWPKLQFDSVSVLLFWDFWPKIEVLDLRFWVLGLWSCCCCISLSIYIYTIF